MTKVSNLSHCFWTAKLSLAVQLHGLNHAQREESFTQTQRQALSFLQDPEVHTFSKWLLKEYILPVIGPIQFPYA